MFDTPRKLKIVIDADRGKTFILVGITVSRPNTSSKDLSAFCEANLGGLGEKNLIDTKGPYL